MPEIQMQEHKQDQLDCLDGGVDFMRLITYLDFLLHVFLGGLVNWLLLG